MHVEGVDVQDKGHQSCHQDRVEWVLLGQAGDVQHRLNVQKRVQYVEQTEVVAVSVTHVESDVVGHPPVNLKFVQQDLALLNLDHFSRFEHFLVFQVQVDQVGQEEGEHQHQVLIHVQGSLADEVPEQEMQRGLVLPFLLVLNDV